MTSVDAYNRFIVDDMERFYNAVGRRLLPAIPRLIPGNAIAIGRWCRAKLALLPRQNHLLNQQNLLGRKPLRVVIKAI